MAHPACSQLTHEHPQRPPLGLPHLGWLPGGTRKMRSFPGDVAEGKVGDLSQPIPWVTPGRALGREGAQENGPTSIGQHLQHESPHCLRFSLYKQL